MSSSKEEAGRVRALSARSFDPLPEVPKLVLAEKSKDRDDDDSDEEFPYVEVPGDERMPESDSDEGRSDHHGNAEPSKPASGSSPFPPYGKVSRHSKPPNETSRQDDEDNDSYAQVRDVVRRGPLLLPQRNRSQTDPQNPGNMGGHMHDKQRALTESGLSAPHMPLPDIPASGIPAEEKMYDSIPEAQGKKGSPKSKPQALKKREILYESVTEMGEKDLYESVPDSLANMDSPVSPKTLSMPALSPTKMLSEVPPLPPSSPIPSNKAEQGKKRTLEKTQSAAVSHEEKRRFSFFGRKKTSSVSTKPTKHPPESPTTTSPLHKLHPLPNIPAPPRPDQGLGDEEEDTYDKVVSAPASSGLDHDVGLSDTAKTKSLPMTYRTGGGRPNLPLPDLPENSGSGTCTVQHQRMMEGGEGPDEYDTVHRPPQDYIPDEPNYDTVNILKPLRRDDVVDPPYDKIDKQELQELRERELQARANMSPQHEGTPEGELDVSGLPPDHDEEGYAVVPEEIRMRKRAESQGAQTRKGAELSPTAGYHRVRRQEDEQGYDTVREGRSHTLPVSPQRSAGEDVEDQYASINIMAKKDRKQRELEEMLRQQEELKEEEEEDARMSSPIPPPLPPALDTDDMEEFQQPPVPAQSEGIHDLSEGELRIDIGDHPYAKIRNKTTNPYAEVSQPYAEVDVTQLQSRAKARSSSPGGGLSEDVLDEAAGYDVIGTVGVRTKVVKDKPYDTIENVQGENAFDEAAGYDVIGTVGVKTRIAQKDKPHDTIPSTKDAPCQLEQDMPTLETAESPEGNIYDTLLPDNASEGEEYDPKSQGAPRSMV